MKNIINLADPPITTYPSIANVLSLLWREPDAIMPWLSDHFIQLIVRPSHEHTYGDFYDHADIDNFYRILYGAPGLGWMRANSNCARFETFTDYIEYQIDSGYCLEACLDRYYFSFTVEYQTTHNIHSSFIYGYDNERKVVYVADLWTGWGKYVKQEISYDEVNASMNNDYIINLFKSQESDYKFDKSLMRKYLLDYYYSRDSFCKYEYSYQSYNRDAIFGLKYYDYLLYDLKESERPDIRLYHILFDQKTLMDYRFKYLATLKEQFDPDKMQKLITMNTQLIGDSLELRNCALKYNLGHSAKAYSRVENRIKNLKELDQKFVEEILSQTTDE